MQHMKIELYNGKNCPCPSDCIRHGQCKKCIAFHRSRNELNYCEYIKKKEKVKFYTIEGAVPSGKELRLLDYGPCAG